MPKLETTSNILPFYVLVKAALSLTRANNSNFHFLKFLGNGFEITEYNSFNTKFAREADVRLHPATHVTYMSLINMNPAESDTMLRRVERFLPNSRWHAYLDVFCWMYQDFNGKHWSVRSAKINIWKCWETPLPGKNFPQSKKALRICVDEILRSILQDKTVFDFDSIMVLLNSSAKKAGLHIYICG